MNIYGEKILLRAMEPEDMEMYREMVNDPEIERMIGGWSFPVSSVEQRQWYERAVTDKRNLRFTIELPGEGAVGMVNLVDIDWRYRSGFHGMKLRSGAPKRQGIGTDAVMTLMYYAFEELQFVRLDGSWGEYNKKSLELYKKCGWIVEGVKEKAIFRSGRYYSLYIGGILAEGYYEAKKRLGWNPGGKGVLRD